MSLEEDSPAQFSQSKQAVAINQQQPQTEPTFYYFAYGSCMCPVDLKRSLGENTYPFVIGSAQLKGYRLAFNRKSVLRNCGVLDVVQDPAKIVEGVLYCLPWRLSNALDVREEVPRGGYRREAIDVYSQGRLYKGVRTYAVVDKLAEELAPNDWYFQVVIRGAITCGLTESYCWQLFNHMHQLQQQQLQV
ncbi:MAG: gamma-glutamylcyclotransferase [Symploca sp. SIO3C6]|uniref:Gamma-glutamylcyclotransferase n=1 Tax=Symploca sp. SIO1C4 TaxID=2607765 RepID=A0A6B3NFK3_9CYAN|nr:gamma-glutamylcyclotransferase [Symploca sp. SIO3C6]NER29725.1 gamma-glutamylcyclotransferase [Symploca sp. SIO1C4]NET06077.1 gamma-glutamylcyclotransferase [Symploca sp. SIO2B6]NET52116.1 gamma-glutamylcyclotransferase [Merismopedia sp. SIO2A8]